MKIVATFFALLLVPLAGIGFGQGSLTPPPGPPGPTMKTLDQVEARTIVNATNTPGDGTNSYIISLPGSYYLTGNLVGESGKHGISIQASDVTLDLNGFTLTNITPGEGTVCGVDVPAEQKNICVRNGTIRLWNGGGVQASQVRAAVMEKLRVMDCTGATGIHVWLGSLIQDCVANMNGIGFQTADRCQVINCISTENTGHGFLCASYVSLLDCTSSRNGGYGFFTGGGCSLQRCSATRNLPSGYGIVVGTGTNVHTCTASQNGGTGIFADRGSVIASCTSSSNFADGIGCIAGVVKDCAAWSNAIDGITLYDSVGANCTSYQNGMQGFSGTGGSLSGSRAASNGSHGIYFAFTSAVDPGTGGVTDCSASDNLGSGILTSGAVHASHATKNERDGIRAGAVTNSFAHYNGDNGIVCFGGVVAFCAASTNNQRNNGSVEIQTSGAATTRTGNNPTP